jgi:superfamily II DNA or RNA helicase
VNVEKDPVLFYWIDKPKNEIVLPYTFANVLLNKHWNSNLSYPESKFFFTGKLREHQEPVAEQALEQLKKHGTSTLCLGTGFGKSALSAYLASQLGGLTLVITNRETIQKGWQETFSKNTTAKVWTVETNIRIPKSCNVILTMNGRLNKIPWEIRKMVSVLVVDEFHMFLTASQVPVLLGTCPKYIIGCTATPTRPDGMERMLYTMVGKHNITVKNDKKFTVYKFMTGIKTELVKNKMGTVDFSKLTSALAENPLRNAFIVDLIEKNLAHKIMLLTWSKSHVQTLYTALQNRNVSVDYLTGNKSKYVDSQVLLGTISKVSTGFDSKNVAIDFDGMDISMMIFLASTKSFNLHIQSIGRAFRSDNPVIFDFVDDNRISQSHWRAREKNYNEMNCEIHHVKMYKKDSEPEQITQNVAEMQRSKLEVHRQKYAKILG